MKKTRLVRLTLAATILVAIAGVIAPEATARSATKWQPNTATRWEVGFGGDAWETGYNPTEKQPKFIAGGNLASDDSDGPWLEWVSKISELPSGVFPEAGLAVVDGIIYVSGAATNSFLALDAKTGLPVWRFSPDQRTDGSTASYPAANGPVVKNGIVYMPFSNGWVYALNAKTGKKIWSYQAKEGYRGPAPTVPPGNERCAGGKCARGDDQFDAIHPGVAYPKINGALTYCKNTVSFMTLSGWAYGVHARSGKLLWKKYADAPLFPGELTWWEYPVGGALSLGAETAGGSTRRFEAVPGVACVNDEVLVAGTDGVARFLDPLTGKDSTQGGNVGPKFDRIEAGSEGPVNHCQASGWNCDIAINMAIPPLGAPGGGDYLITTLDSRIIRLDWRTHEAVWKRTYPAPLPIELESPLGDDFLLTLDHEQEQGFITQAVVGGNMALDPDVKGKGADPIVYAMSQDGRLYVLAINRPNEPGGCLRPADGPSGPCLLARVGVQANKDGETPYTRRGEGGPWDFNQHALSGNVLGGNVLYVSTWDNKMTAFDVRNPANPKKVWVHEIKWDPTFKYPPFGQTYKEPFIDIDNKIFSAPALLGGHLYFAANDGSVYAFNLHKKVKTVRNLVLLGSGRVPFIPDWKDKLGAFDRVWTPAEWYKNQVPPAGYRFPKSAGIAGASSLLLGAVVLLWWYARRDDYEIEVAEQEALP